ncbi:dihydropteroate synthase [Telmatospirillum sp. J64-1]|uniref:dihydropteroate synthase n=1 Tax=Telmatospirillum sp. J64-1 TaxID=2502183 RepID=UPI002105AFED|nr:dihydropteroate synthase [Telmatospirillum sp. J64-1]
MWEEAPEGRLYLQPCGIVSGAAASAAVATGQGWSLAGGPLAFTACTLYLRDGANVVVSHGSFAEILDWSANEGEPVAGYVSRLLHRIGAERPAYAGLAMDRPCIMGIINATPDSFSDGGDHYAAGNAVASALAMLEAGAEIIDVGGESTRPGSAPVSPEEEIRRVVPVIRELANRGAVVSVDTRHAAVMGAALDAGAAILNDITALEGDPDSLPVAARAQVPVMLMHMQGEPGTMQQNPRYGFAPLDVYDYLAGRVAACRAAGIPPELICIDPGIGFGKTVDHNLEIMARLSLFHGLGCPILLGTSRKSFIGRLSKGEAPKDRLAGSLATGLAGLGQGVQMLRVHDVAETAQAVAVWRAMVAVA